MHILPLLSRSYSDFAMVFCHCNATFLQIISSLSSLARSFCNITKPISVRLQQTENKSVCNFVVPCRKPCKTKRRFAKIKRCFSATKRRFVPTKRRFVVLKRRFIFAKRRFVLQGFRQGTTKLQTLLLSVCCNLTEIGFVIWQNERARD